MSFFSSFYIKTYFMYIPLVMTPGFALDIFFGDPRWMPHPVKAVGLFSNFLERALIGSKHKKLAGSLMVFLVITAVLLISSALTFLIHIFVSAIFSAFISAFIIYASIAIKDLKVHAIGVYKSLKKEDLFHARQSLSKIVGRDTEHLTEAQIVKATIESIAENSVDGIFSPLFYGFAFGAPGSVVFKAVSTLDSMFGYKDKRYLKFGWASARLDDWLNFIPARISILIFIITAFLFNRSASRTTRTIFRDRSKHPSPNSAIGESALAGILGIRLGGSCRYGGKETVRPYIGEQLEKIEAGQILAAIKAVYMFSFISLGFFLLLYFPLILYLYGLV